MKPDHRNTLCLAFEKELLAAPKEASKWLVLNSHPLPEDPLAGAQAVHEQGFRPTFLALEHSGAQVVPCLEGDAKADGAIVVAGRVREVNERNIHRARQAAGADGLVVVAGDKTSGIHALRKWVNAIEPIEESYSKHHALCFWLRGTAETVPEPDHASKGPIFSSGSPDKGSILLGEYFSGKIGGKVADLGAGNGFLVRQLLEKSDKVQSVDLMEAEWAALEQAKTSLSDASIPLSFQWMDVTTELVKKPMDWVIMNPPFHHGLGGSRAADPDLGRRFIRQAASTLVPGGRLLMVANRTLPYEETLQKNFRKVERLADQDGFKVFEAVK